MPSPKAFISLLRAEKSATFTYYAYACSGRLVRGRHRTAVCTNPQQLDGGSLLDGSQRRQQLNGGA